MKIQYFAFNKNKLKILGIDFIRSCVNVMTILKYK